MSALILVDIQNDFMPGGAFPVKDGDKILPVVNALLQYPFEMRIATKDWHPHNHGSFAAVHGKPEGSHITLKGLDQILWPVHCVQNTPGAEFAPGWDSKKIDQIVYKGTDKDIDSYSTFFDNGHLKSTGLEQILWDNQIQEIFIAGLATDYCVKYSVLDALKLGFTVNVVVKGCRGINIHPDDTEKALLEMQKAGANLV